MGLSDPTLYNFLSVALFLCSRRRNLGALGNRSSIFLDYLYKSVHGITSVFERVDLDSPNEEIHPLQAQRPVQLCLLELSFRLHRQYLYLIDNQRN